MRWFKKNGVFKSVFLKFTLAFIIVGLIPLLFFSYFSLNRFSQNIEMFSLNNFEQRVFFASKNLEKIASEYNNITEIMYSYNSGEYGNLVEIIKNSNVLDRREGLALTKMDRLMDDFTKNVLYSNQYLENVIFINQINKKLYQNTKTIKLFDSNYDFIKSDYYKEVIDKKRTMTILPPHTEFYFAKSNKQVITFARNFLDISALPAEEKILGTIFLDVDLSVFDELFHRLMVEDKGETYVIDDKGFCIYSSGLDNISQKLGWYSDMEKAFQDKNYNGYIDTSDAYYIFQKVENSNWMVVYRIYKKDILKRVEDIRNFVSFIIIVCIVALILVAVAFSNSFSLPIKRIIRQMKKVESGNLEVSVEVKSRDEVGQLARGFNNMISELKGYINKAYIAQIKQKEAELTALKTQIRPHFLYNTLEVIRMCAVENEDDKVADMIHSLSAQLKYVIGYNNDLVTLGQEISMIQHYFEIIKVRYDGKIDLEVNISEKMMKMKILKLSLQPIIENAVEHGIKPKDGKGRVLITGEVICENIEISVFDDGIGISSEILDRINNLLMGEKMGKETSEGWKSIGIKNVHDRLRMNFGENYGIDIKSHEKIGTVVKIVMPVLDGVI